MAYSASIKRSITALFAAYGQAHDGKRIAVYTKMLENCPVEVLNKAINKLILEQKFLPTVSEIVQAIQSLFGEATGIRIKTWDEAWEELQARRLECSVYRKPVFSTPEIEATAKSFGWRDFCMALEDDRGMVHAQMKKIYESICFRTREKAINGYVLTKEFPIMLGGNSTKVLEAKSE